MQLPVLISRLLSLSKLLHTWLELLTGLDAAHRIRISHYATQIADTLARAADTLARAADALAELERAGKPAASRALAREIGRIAGYIEDIVILLDARLDGRQLAGVKRRLESLCAPDAPLLSAGAGKPDHAASQRIAHLRILRLAEAEGYFRALADGLRV